MPQRSWRAKRERQYDHVKQGLVERGEPERTAEEIAARTVNKERARSGEAKQSSRTSTDDISSGRLAVAAGSAPTEAPGDEPATSSTKMPGAAASRVGRR
jgi:hypothetical protein